MLSTGASSVAPREDSTAFSSQLEGTFATPQDPYTTQYTSWEKITQTATAQQMAGCGIRGVPAVALRDGITAAN